MRVMYNVTKLLHEKDKHRNDNSASLTLLNHAGGGLALPRNTSLALFRLPSLTLSSTLSIA